MFWELSEQVKDFLVSNHFSQYGNLIGKLSSPNSTIFTFKGPGNLIVAKCINIDPGTSREESRKRIQRALYEVNTARFVMHNSAIQRFFHIEIMHGIPFFLSRKREATLYDLIYEGPLELDDLLVISCQIVYALCYCRKMGIISHQDLKPENIFLDFTKNKYNKELSIKHLIYVADFELANAYLVLGKKSGSRPYYPPEQHSKNSEDFSKVDVFALGVLIYEMATGGKHPIGERTSDVWPKPLPLKGNKWLREDVWKKWAKNAAISRLDQDIKNVKLVDIINKCLIPDFEKRIGLIELKDELFELLNDVSKEKNLTLQAIFKMYDDASEVNEKYGLPYYERMIEELNIFYDYIE